MPTYQYACNDCRDQFEQFQKFSDEALTDCPSCGGKVRRVIQNVGVVFKGSGWYINDSRSKPKGKSSDDSGGGDKAGVESGAGEKPAAESTTKTKDEKPAKSDKPAKSASAAAS